MCHAAPWNKRKEQVNSFAVSKTTLHEKKRIFVFAYAIINATEEKRPH